MKKVIILLSAYNGEKYIREQIKSIINQTYSEIKIYVRDDGSKDQTPQILKEFADEGMIKLYLGENIGFVKSFLWLVKNCENADYYAFADQDDVWKPDKITRAVQMLQRENNERLVPTVYCSSFDICDEALNITGKIKDLFIPFTIVKTITSGETGFGVTQVFNDALRKEVLSKTTPNLSRVFGHDTYVHLIGVCLGKVVYDRESTLFYRRHSSNTSTQDYRGGNIISHQIWRIWEFLFHANGKKIYLDVREFYDLFKNELDETSCKIFELYLEPSYKIKNVWKKITYRGRYRKNIVDEIALRMLFLFNRM